MSSATVKKRKQRRIVEKFLNMSREISPDLQDGYKQTIVQWLRSNANQKVPS